MRDILCSVMYDSIYLRKSISFFQKFSRTVMLVKQKSVENPEVRRRMQLSPDTFIMAHLLMYLRSSVYKILVQLETQKESRTSVTGIEKRHEFRQYCENKIDRIQLQTQGGRQRKEESKGNLMSLAKAFLQQHLFQSYLKPAQFATQSLKLVHGFQRCG